MKTLVEGSLYSDYACYLGWISRKAMDSVCSPAMPVT